MSYSNHTVKREEQQMSKQITITVDVNDELVERILSYQEALDLTHEEVKEGVENFLNEVNSKDGLALLLENLDYFNC